jgi:hypothetical protein
VSPAPLAAFWPHTDDERVASVRLRCSLIVQELQRRGVDARIYRAGADVPRTLVLSKRYDAESLAHAQALRARHGMRLVLDLCDNHFHYERAVEPFVRRAADLAAAVRSVDRVVAASNALADVVRKHVPQAPPIDVIGDLIEPRLPPPRRWRERLRQRGRLLRLRWHLHRAAAAAGRRLVWFGNHGSPNVDGGMSDLQSVQQALQDHHRSRRLSLTVISNSREHFDALTRGWTIPCVYLPWSAATFDDALALHDIALIPVRANPFTLCKTANRVATASVHGLGVAADAIPAYEEFGDCIVLGDWGGGLARLMDRADERAAAVARARARLDERYAPSVIGARWLALLQAGA